MTRIWIVEEYGYRHWLWVHPGDVDDVVASWKRGRAPVDFWGRRTGAEFDGTAEQFDPHAHIWAKLEKREVPVDDAMWKALAEDVQVMQGTSELLKEHRCLGVAHVHMHDDTGLTIMGVHYGPWWDDAPWADEVSEQSR